MGQTTLSTEDPTRNPHSALPSSCWLYQRQKDAVLNFILRLPILPLLFTQDQQGVTELTALNNKTLRGSGEFRSQSSRTVASVGWFNLRRFRLG